MYCIVKTTTGNSGKTYKSFAARYGSTRGVEFRRPGDSMTGVGISGLMTWKTEDGAKKFLAQIGPGRTDLTIELVTS